MKNLFHSLHDSHTDKSKAMDIVTGKIYSPESTPVIEGDMTPKYDSWEAFLSGTSEKERMNWCSSKARKANNKRLLSGCPELKITAEDVWKILESAKGVCCYCGSIALEKRPSGRNGKPITWAYMGRRIGSLDHNKSRVDGGTNKIDNLRWSCLWCNTWKSERRSGATDHGGYPITMK